MVEWVTTSFCPGTPGNVPLNGPLKVGVFTALQSNLLPSLAEVLRGNGFT